MDPSALGPGRGHLAGHPCQLLGIGATAGRQRGHEGFESPGVRTEVSFPAAVIAVCACWSPRGSPARTWMVASTMADWVRLT